MRRRNFVMMLSLSSKVSLELHKLREKQRQQLERLEKWRVVGVIKEFGVSNYISYLHNSVKLFSVTTPWEMKVCCQTVIVHPVPRSRRFSGHLVSL